MYPMTLKEVLERLARLDEVTLMELLSVTSEDLVEVFKERIEDNLDFYINEVDFEEE